MNHEFLLLAVVMGNTRRTTNEKVVTSRNLLPSVPYALGDRIARRGGSKGRIGF